MDLWISYRIDITLIHIIHLIFEPFHYHSIEYEHAESILNPFHFIRLNNWTEHAESIKEPFQYHPIEYEHAESIQKPFRYVFFSWVFFLDMGFFLFFLRPLLKNRKKNYEFVQKNNDTV